MKLALALAASLIAGQEPDRALADAIGAIYRLRDYTAFDWITGRYERGTLTLRGFVRNPSLKARAEAAARRAARIEEVVNNLEVLPPLAGDDVIRVRAYEAIFASSGLERYAPGGRLPDTVLSELTEAERVGLDAVDVGRGPHGIHIIVSGARVLLLGEVRASGDRQQAEARVRGLPGVLAVSNQLLVAGR